MTTYLLTWHPERSVWPDHAAGVTSTVNGQSVEMRWSAGGTKQIVTGDRLFMLRQGVEPRGIVGSGTAATDWFEEEHWDPQREGESTTYVRVRFDRIAALEGTTSDVVLVETLNDLLPALQTNIQRSGTKISDDVAIGLEQLWQPTSRLPLVRSEDFPDGITRGDVLDAMAYLDQHGLPPTFAESTDFDVLNGPRRYPPKAVAGLAARRLRGRLMFSQEFRGGEDTRCFKLLRTAGFDVVPKAIRPNPFHIGDRYTRRDIQMRLGLTPTDGGDWATGHHREGDDTFIFATLGGPGRTGHQYNNRWVGDLFHWETKNGLAQSASPVRAMLHPPTGGRVYIFTRSDDRSPFTFEGVGRPVEVRGERPVTIVWELESRVHVASPGELPSGVKYREGAVRQVTVLAYERDPEARRDCIAHYGCCCSVCGLDFEKVYGELGRGFVHVHHLNQLADSDGEREVDPVEDLRPVCPNCHAMLHRGESVMSIKELTTVIRAHGWLDVVRRFQSHSH